MHKDNVIFQDAIASNVSGAKTRHYGAELSLDYRLNDHWYARLTAPGPATPTTARSTCWAAKRVSKATIMQGAPEAFGKGASAEPFAWRTATHPGAGCVPGFSPEPENEHQYDGHSLFNLRVSARADTCHIPVHQSAGRRLRRARGLRPGEYRYFVSQPAAPTWEISYQFGT